MKDLRRHKLNGLLNGPRFNGDRKAFCQAAGITNGRLTQLLDPKEPFGDVAAQKFNHWFPFGPPSEGFFTPSF